MRNTTMTRNSEWESLKMLFDEDGTVRVVCEMRAQTFKGPATLG